MDYLFQVMGQLQAALAPLADDEDVQQTLSQLPQIVVVGGQSAGKSSLLESVANMPGFLPKGSGLVTARPLLLRLQTDPSKRLQVATFQNPRATNVLPNSPIYDAALIRKCIEDENKGCDVVSAEPIQLTMSGPDLPTITVIDLPGFTPNTEYRATLPAEINKMVTDVVKDKDNILMLAVTSALEDTTNSTAEPFVRIIDPQRLRTIGVYTKLDRTTDDSAWQKLCKASASHSPKWVGVKLPDTAKLLRFAQSPSTATVRFEEQEWFDLQLRTEHVDCAGMQNVGVHYLLWRVQKWLVPQIQRSLDSLKQSMEAGLQMAKSELEKVPRTSNTSSLHDISNMIGGICRVFDTKFARTIAKAGGSQFVGLVDEYRFKEIHTDLEFTLSRAAVIIKEAKGLNRGVGSWSEEGCRELAAQAIESFVEPASAMLARVQVLTRQLAKEELMGMTQQLGAYPLLKAALLQAADDAIFRRTKQAEKDVRTTLDKHKAQLDELTMTKLKKRAETSLAVKEELVATTRSSQDWDQPLTAAHQLRSQAAIKERARAEEEAEAARYVEVTRRVVYEYITEHVEKRLALEIPASWQFFMFGGLNRDEEGLLSSVSCRPDCFEQMCVALKDSASSSSHAKLAAYLDEDPENAMRRTRLHSKQKAYQEALEGLKKVAEVPALGSFQRLQKPATIIRMPSTLPGHSGSATQPSAPLLPTIADAQEDAQPAAPAPAPVSSSSDAAQHAVIEEHHADAVEKCEAGVGITLRALVWGVEWLAYSAKYIMVQTYGAFDKTVSTGGCRHEASPGFGKRQQSRAGMLQYKQSPPPTLSQAVHRKARQVHQAPGKTRAANAEAKQPLLISTAVQQPAS